MVQQIRFEAILVDKATGGFRKIQREIALTGKDSHFPKLKSEVADLTRQMVPLSGGMNVVAASLGRVNVAAGLTAVGLGVAALAFAKVVSAIPEFTKRTRELRDVAHATGTSMRAMREFQQVAQSFDIAPESATRGMQHLSTQLSLLQHDSGDLM